VTPSKCEVDLRHDTPRLIGLIDLPRRLVGLVQFKDPDTFDLDLVEVVLLDDAFPNANMRERRPAPP
jgi:hypothetical protein